MESIIIASVAALISACSLVVSFLNYRSSGSRVYVVTHSFDVRGTDIWLSAKVANAGKTEVDLEGATCDALGPTTTQLPERLKSGSSLTLTFRAPLASATLVAGSVTLSVGLGTGRVLTAQLRLDDPARGLIRVVQERLNSGEVRAVLPLGRSQSQWTPPALEEL